MKAFFRPKITGFGAATAVLVVGVIPAVAFAATTADSKLTQQISPGVISTSIRDASGSVVPSPTFALGATSVSNSTQTTTGTFGSNTQRITVDNPNGSTNGGAWSLALNATTPASDKWTSGSNNYLYNGTAATGQLTVNPAAGTLTSVTGGSTGITLGSAASFSGSGAITLATASTSAAAIWNGYITGIGLSQSIPASQAAGTYTLNMTQTVTAL